MNAKTAKMLRRVAGVGNRQGYQALKREWATLSVEERTRRRRAASAPPAKEPAGPAAAPEARPAAPAKEAK